MASVEVLNGPEVATQVPQSDPKEHTSSVVGGTLVDDSTPSSGSNEDCLRESKLNGMDAFKNELEGSEPSGIVSLEDSSIKSAIDGLEKQPEEKHASNTVSHDTNSEVTKAEVSTLNKGSSLDTQENDIGHDGSNAVHVGEGDKTMEISSDDQLPTKADLKETSSVPLATETPTSSETPKGSANLPAGLQSSKEASKENQTQILSPMEDVSLPTEASTVADSTAIPAASGTMANESLVVDAGSLTTTIDQGKVEDGEPEAKANGGLVVDPGNVQSTQDQQSVSQDSVRNAEESTLSVEKALLEEDKQPSVNPPVETQSPEQAVEQVPAEPEEDTVSAGEVGNDIPLASGTIAEESLVVDAGSVSTFVGQEKPLDNKSAESEVDEGLVVDAGNAQTAEGQQPSVSRDTVRDAEDGASSLAGASQSSLWDGKQPSDNLPMELESSKKMAEDNQTEIVPSEESDSLSTQVSTVADSKAISVASGVAADESLVVDAVDLTSPVKQEESDKDKDSYSKVDEGLVVDAGNPQIAENQEQLASQNPVQGAVTSSAGDAPLTDDKQTSDHSPVKPQSFEQVDSVQESQIEALPPRDDVSVSTEPSNVADSSAIPPAFGTAGDNSLVVDAGSLTTSINQEQSVDNSNADSKVDERSEVDAGCSQITEDWRQSAEEHSAQDEVLHQVEPSRSASEMNSNTESNATVTVVNDVEKSEDELVKEQTEAVQKTEALGATKGEPVAGGKDAALDRALDANPEPKMVDALATISDTTATDTAAQETNALRSTNSELGTDEQGVSNQPTDSEVPAHVPDDSVKDVTNLVDGKGGVTEGEPKQGTDVSVPQESILESQAVDGKVSTAPNNAVSETAEEVDSVSIAGEQGNHDTSADSGTPDKRQGEPIELVEGKTLDVTEGESQEGTVVGSFESPLDSKVTDELPAAPDIVVSHKALADTETDGVPQDDVGTSANEVWEQMPSKIVEQQVAVESTASEGSRQTEGELKEDTTVQAVDALPATPDTTLPEPRAEPVDEVTAEPKLMTHTADFDPAPPDAPTSTAEANTTNESENKSLEADSGSVPSQDESVVRQPSDHPVPESEPSAESSAELSMDKTISDKGESTIIGSTTVLQSAIPEDKETIGSMETSVETENTPDKPAPLQVEDAHDDGEVTSEDHKTVGGTPSAGGPPEETKSILPATLGSDVPDDQAKERARVEVSDTVDADITGGEYEQETHVDNAVNTPARTVEEEQVAEVGQEPVGQNSDNVGKVAVSSVPLDVKIHDSTSDEAKPHLQVTEEIERPKSPWTPSYSVTNQGPGIAAEEDIPEIESKSETKPADEPASVVNEAPSVNVVAPSALHVEGITLEDKLAQTQPQRNDTVTDNSPRPKSPWTPSYSVSRQGSPAPPVTEEASKQEKSRPDDAAPSAEDVPDGVPVTETISEGGQHSEIPELAAPGPQSVEDEVQALLHNQASRNSQVQEPGLEVQQHDIPPVKVSEPQEEPVGAKEPSGDATQKASSSADNSSASVQPSSPWTRSYSVSVQGSPQPSLRELPTEAPVESQPIQSKEEKDELPNQDLHATSSVTSPSQGEQEISTDDHPKSNEGIVVADVSTLKALAVPSPDEVEGPTEQSQSQADTVTQTTTVAPDTQTISQESPAAEEQQSEAADVTLSQALENTDVKEPLAKLDIPAFAPEPESKSPWTSSYSVTKQGRDTPPEKVVASAATQPDPKDTEILSAPATADLNKLTVDTSSTSSQNTPQRPRSPWTPSYSVMRQGAASTDALIEDAELAKLEQLPVSVTQNVEAPTDGEQAKSDLESEPFPTSGSYEEEGSLTSLDTVTGSRDAPSSPSGRSRLESTASSLIFPGGWYSRPPPGRASLDNAKGEFVASKQSSPGPVQPAPKVSEETVVASTSVGANEDPPANEEKKSKWCTIM